MCSLVITESISHLYLQPRRTLLIPRLSGDDKPPHLRGQGACVAISSHCSPRWLAYTPVCARPRRSQLRQVDVTGCGCAPTKPGKMLPPLDAPPRSSSSCTFRPCSFGENPVAYQQDSGATSDSCPLGAVSQTSMLASPTDGNPSSSHGTMDRRRVQDFQGVLPRHETERVAAI